MPQGGAKLVIETALSGANEMIEPRSEGRGVGLGQMIQQPGILLGPFLFGRIVDATASFRLAWLLVAGFLLLAMLTVATVRESPQSLVE